MTWHIVRKLFLLEFCASVAARVILRRSCARCVAESCECHRCTMQLDPAYWNSLHALYGGHKVMLSNPPDALVTCHVGPKFAALS